MAGNQHPWRDVMPNEAWQKVLEATNSQQDQSVNSITNQLSKYHLIQKTNSSYFDQRINELRNIANLTVNYLNQKHGQAGYQKSNNKKLSVSTKVNLRGQHTVSIAEKDIDRWVYSLGRRALKKAGYLQELKNSPVKHLSDVSQFKTYLKNLATKIQKNSSPELLRLDPSVKPEKWDPYHRPIEVIIDLDRQEVSVGREHTPISGAFVGWCSSNSPLPFFVWLEGEPICTQEGYLKTTLPEVSRIQYELSNREGIRQVFIKNGSLVARPCFDWGTTQLLDTKSGQHKNGEAFVWLRTGNLLIHTHVVGNFHHSSFNGGHKVLCAGTMTVQNGKIKRVDNNSGHYKPTTRHFLTFLKLLDDKKVLADDALIATHDINKGKQGVIFWAALSMTSRQGLKRKA
ncbi:MAG: hypothetical protein R3F37_16725 [Candidatus Competibacteraceae bacterium]